MYVCIVYIYRHVSHAVSGLPRPLNCPLFRTVTQEILKNIPAENTNVFFFRNGLQVTTAMVQQSANHGFCRYSSIFPISIVAWHLINCTVLHFLATAISQDGSCSRSSKPKRAGTSTRGLIRMARLTSVVIPALSSLNSSNSHDARLGLVHWYPKVSACQQLV